MPRQTITAPIKYDIIILSSPLKRVINNCYPISVYPNKNYSKLIIFFMIYMKKEPTWYTIVATSQATNS